MNPPNFYVGFTFTLNTRTHAHTHTDTDTRAYTHGVYYVNTVKTNQLPHLIVQKNRYDDTYTMG